MEARRAEHFARMRHLREAFAEANERLVTRLREATDEAAEAAPPDGWSAAQIGWHVARMTNRFAGVLSGDAPGAQPLPADFRAREWAEIATAIPAKLQAAASVQPPAGVRRSDAIADLEASGVRMARAFDALTLDRGARFGLTHPVTGAITLYQVGEWATTHVVRHDRQAARALGSR